MSKKIRRKAEIQYGFCKGDDIKMAKEFNANAKIDGWFHQKIL